MEISIISAQGLKNTANFFSHTRLRPFITITTNGDKYSHVYKTRADDKGGVDPTWGENFHLPIDFRTFFYDDHQRIPSQQSCIYLQVYTKRPMVGPAQLGWCRIPAADIVNEFFPAAGIRRLSYGLRARDGSRGHGVVNIAIRIKGLIPVEFQRFQSLFETDFPVIGIPVEIYPEGGKCSCMCHEH